MYSRNRMTAFLAAVTVALGLGACNDSSSPSSPSNSGPQFQNNSRQAGLVNVSTGDVALLNNVNLAVAANVIANVCGVVIPVAVLSQQIIANGSVTECNGTAAPITVDQAVPGANQPGGSAGGNTSQQSGLINVSLGNVDILNNVNAAIAANVLVSACGLTVPVAIAAAQAAGDVSQTVCTTDAGPILISQSPA